MVYYTTLTRSQMKSRTDTMFFWDGERRIDMVLAYEDDDPYGAKEDGAGEEDEEDEEAEEGGMFTRAQKRANFEKNLLDQGLELELEPAKVWAYLITAP